MLGKISISALINRAGCLSMPQTAASGKSGLGARVILRIEVCLAANVTTTITPVVESGDVFLYLGII